MTGEASRRGRRRGGDPATEAEDAPVEAAEADAGGEGARRNSLGRALPLLSRLAEHPRGVSLDVLADEARLPKSTLHRLLASLCQVGFAEQLENGSYRLGMEFVRTAFRFHDARDEPALVQPALDALADRFGEHAFFATLDGTEVVYLGRASAVGEALQIAVRVGDRAPAHATALGKAMLAFSLADDQAVIDWVATHGPLVERTLAAVAGPLKLATDLRVVRQRGYALERQETAGLDTLALPIFLDAPLRPTGAIGIVALAARTSADQLARIAEDVRAVIEGELGEVTRPRGTPEPRRSAPTATPTPASARAPAPPRSRGGARIVSVEPIVVHAGRCNYTFVRIGTRDGLTGIGEATLEWQTESMIAAIHELGRAVVGEDSARIEHIWQQLRRGGFWRGGPILMSALSGIEHALWDIKGKVAGLPVYELLGGAVRDRVLLYANGPRGDTPAELAASARAIVARGFTGLKLALPIQLLQVDSASALRQAVAAVEAVRAAVGVDVRIAVDAHGRLSPAMAIRFAEAVAHCDLWFLEEPALPEVPRGIRQVAEATTIPIAAGERLHSRWDFHELLTHAGVALVQPDLAHCGGIAEARRIAAMAEIRDIGFAPHNPLSPVNTVVSAHVAMATPNFVALEYLVDDVAWRDSLLTEPLRVEEGHLLLGDGPGLGIELDLDTCRAHPFKPVERPSARRADGSYTEW